ncbi:tRNA dimethylallyltransferase 9 isoform X1 [Vigna radiata var. radiata]|uniref:tRNA dimethylallyltransferase n=1 Tax=Vigna radiata var. radiata TaxID=3916 RepID=A0A1S3TXW9_VIGRR|nr:tRNA dimethylallyltransferase 9 isoform X1 [Vigna radiata var. radiata]
MINNGVCTLRTCFRFPGRLLVPPLQRSFTFRRRFLVTASQRKKKEKVIVISGPTGSGKSRLALELAKSLNGEIVSADSVQVYRGLDVGSAKPSPDERKEVPHHLVDILHPSEDYSVGQFFEDARQATRCILDNGRVPIVVGGTGLYLRWFIYGKPDVPKASPVITSEVNQELAELQRNDDWDTAVRLVVKAGDPKAQFLAVNDWYRLRRSLEIIKSSGSPPSAFRVPYDSFREQGECSVAEDSESSDMNTYSDGMEETSSSDLDYEFMCFFLSSHRLDLYRSIDYRCEDMLLGRDGLLSEAQWLLDTGLHPNSNSATKAIGYRQAMEYLQRCREQGGQSSAAEFYKFLFEFQKASRNFAKRQLTWFRNEKIYQWLDGSKPLETILSFINGAYHDWNGSLPVPEHLRMSRDISNRRDEKHLKSYRSRNRHFVKGEDCSHILNWISKTQR